MTLNSPDLRRLNPKPLPLDGCVLELLARALLHRRNAKLDEQRGELGAADHAVTVGVVRGKHPRDRLLIHNRGLGSKDPEAR